MAAIELEQKNPLAKILTYLLLAGSAVLAIIDIRAVLDIYYFFFALFSGDKLATAARVQSTLGGTVLALVLGLGALVFIIYMVERYTRRAGDPRALRPMLITVAVQAALLAVSLVL